MGEFAEPSIEEFEVIAPVAVTIQAEAQIIRSSEWLSYHQDLMRGLREVKREAHARMASGVRPKLISVSLVLRAAGRGRTQFYEQHGEFHKRILRADAAAKRLWAWIQQKPLVKSRSDLEAEIRSLKIQLHMTERRLASQKLSEIAVMFHKQQG
jgi:hypothetical protein